MIQSLGADLNGGPEGRSHRSFSAAAAHGGSKLSSGSDSGLSESDTSIWSDISAVSQVSSPEHIPEKDTTAAIKAIKGEIPNYDYSSFLAKHDLREIARQFTRPQIQKECKLFCERLIDHFVIDFRAYVLQSLCSEYAYEFNMYDKIDRKFYDQIVKGMANYCTEGIGPKPEKWDFVTLGNIY